MIEEIATVVSTREDKAVIRVEKTSSCNSCNASGACGTASLSRLFNFQAPELTVNNALDARPGDRVMVTIEERALLTGSFLLYITPLLTMIGLALLSGWFAVVLFPGIDPDGLQALGGVAGLAAGLYLVRQLANRFTGNQLQAVMVKRLPLSSNRVLVDSIS